jgi:hypothetical protein
MLEHETLKSLFNFVGILKLPKKQWLDNIGWMMAKFMDKKYRKVIGNAKFLALICDEGITFDT